MFTKLRNFSHRVLRALHHMEAGAHDVADALTWFGHDLAGIFLCVGLLAVSAGWSVASHLRSELGR